MSAGVRKYQSSAQCGVKLLTVSVDIDQQVRGLAARRDIGVARLVREWVIEKLHNEAPQGSVSHDR
jgi:hypothetical protein